MELAYVVQILIAILIINLFLIVLMSTMICASLYSTRPLWFQLREETEMEEVPQPTSQQDWETKCLFGLCPHSSKMPNKRDKIPFQWPQGKDESWFAKREDTFPNGTQLTVYSPNVFQTQIQSCLDKVVSSQLKAIKKWIFVINCAQELIRFISLSSPWLVSTYWVSS